MHASIHFLETIGFRVSLIILKQKRFQYKKCKTNQKQQLLNKKFDIKLRPRYLECRVDMVYR